jgi:hypothetical protein
MRLVQAAKLAAMLMSALAGASGCQAVTGPASGTDITVSVQPSYSRIAPGGSLQFAAAVTGADDRSVVWQIEEADGGTIDASGRYRAPQDVGTYHIRAVAVADGQAVGTARVNVTSSGGTASCEDEPLRTTGPVYYYCDCQSGASAGCTPGDDAAAGTSPSAPRRTFANAVGRFNSMAAGSTVALCRGGSFSRTATAGIYNAACRAASTCDFRDYAPDGMESAPRPVILAGGGDLFRAQTGGHDEGYRFWNLDIRHTGGTGISFWFSSDVTDADVCNVAGNGGDAVAVINPWVARLTIRNSQWSNYANQGVIGGAEDLTIDGNYFSDVGAMRGAQYHSIYLGGGGDAASTPGGWPNELIINNEIRLSSCQGTIVALHGRHVNTLIENNLVVARNASGGCYGIQANNGGYPYSCWFRNLAIRRNRLVLAGSGQGITADQCLDCVVSDNVVALTSPTAGRGILVPDAAARGGMSPPEQVTTGAVIQNNSIYVAAQGPGILIGFEGANYVVENNAIWTNATSCEAISRPTLRRTNNYCRTSGGPALGAVFVDAPNGDLRPVNPGPLIGYGSETNYSPTALSPVWSLDDLGVARAPPIDAGAFMH